MRKIFFTFMGFIVLFLTACSGADEQYHLNEHEIKSNIEISSTDIMYHNEFSVFYISFEDALLMSTDVVIAQYVGQRPFGQDLTEFEFLVNDRILGNAANTIFVYARNSCVSIIGSESVSCYNMGGYQFTKGTNYLLALEKLWGVELNTHEDGYIFISGLVINLDNPLMSTMYNEPLHLHSSELNFRNRSISSEEITSFVSEFTADNPPARQHIRSDCIEDIIKGSPYVLFVEINEPRRLVSEQVTRDWMETDIYFATVIRALKGDVDTGYELAMVFFAYTVQTGEQHIIAAERISEGGTFVFTSRNSLFASEQLEEIMLIVESIN